MAPLKSVESLVDIANKTVTRRVASICTQLDYNEGLSGLTAPDCAIWNQQLVSIIETLPIALLDKLTISTVAFLVKEENRIKGTRVARSYDAPGLHVALEKLPQQSTNILDLGSLFTGARLSRRSSTRKSAVIPSRENTPSVTTSE